MAAGAVLRPTAKAMPPTATSAASPRTTLSHMLPALRGWTRTTGVPGATVWVGKAAPYVGPVAAGGVGADVPEELGPGSGLAGWFGSNVTWISSYS